MLEHTIGEQYLLSRMKKSLILIIFFLGLLFLVSQNVLADKFPNPLKWENVLEFGEYLIIYIFKIGSGLAVLMILIGAFTMVTSTGDPSRVDRGRKTVIWAIVGFAITMLVNGIIALLRALLGAS